MARNYYLANWGHISCEAFAYRFQLLVQVGPTCSHQIEQRHEMADNDKRPRQHAPNYAKLPILVNTCLQTMCTIGQPLVTNMD